MSDQLQFIEKILLPPDFSFFTITATNMNYHVNESGKVILVNVNGSSNGTDTILREISNK